MTAERQGVGPRWRRGFSGLSRWIDARFGGEESLANDFKPDADAIEQQPLPVSTHAALYAVVALIAMAILWAFLGSLDRIVVARGRVVTAAPLIVMQPFITSRIAKIHVKAGERVTAGQLLISFDPAFARADEASLRQKDRALAAEITRIGAELDGRDFPLPTDAGAELRAQAELFRQRRSQLSAELAVRDSRLEQIATRTASEERNIVGLADQFVLAQKIAGMREELETKGAGSTLQTMIAKKEEIDFDLRLKTATAERDKLIQERAEVTAERRSFLDRWRADLNQRLVSARQEAAQTRESLAKASRLNELTELRAPVDAVVLELADRSEGSVLREAETLITLVPDDAELKVEAGILSRDVGYVKLGDPVRVKFEAYPFQQYGTLEGVLEVVSPDSLPLKEGDRSQVIFQARIRLDETAGSVSRLGIRLRPGLVATAEIKAGERSIASYIVDPIVKTADEGLREP